MSGPKQYYRLRFRPAGAKRDKTVLVRLLRRRRGLVSFMEVDREGSDRERVTATHIQTFLIVLTEAEVEGRLTPMRMNLHYGELEVAS